MPASVENCPQKENCTWKITFGCMADCIIFGAVKPLVQEGETAVESQDMGAGIRNRKAHSVTDMGGIKRINGYKVR